MKHPRLVILPALAGLLTLCACQTARPLYYWGNYESALYTSYAKPDKMPPSELAARLEKDLTKAAAANLAVNPGLHAQLGMTYLELGRADDALREFETEKALFPESAVFMDRFISKLKGAPKK